MTILLISEREKLIVAVKSLENEVTIIKSSEEAVSFLGKNMINLVILDLAVNDLNIFVAHELLKSSKTKSKCPVLIITSKETEGEVGEYEKLQYPPDEFIDNNELIKNTETILKKYFDKIGKEESPTGIDLKGDNSYEENILEEIDNMDIFNDDLLEETEQPKQGIFTVEDAKDNTGQIDLTIGDNSEILTTQVEKKSKKTSADTGNTEAVKDKIDLEIDKNSDKKIKELEAEIVSLKKQYDFIKNDNKELQMKNDELENKSKTQAERFETISTELENTKSATTAAIELKDNEIKEIKEELSNEIEELKKEIESITSDKKILETSLMDEITHIKSEKEKLAEEKDKISAELELIKNTFEDIENQLDLKTKEVDTIRKDMDDLENAKNDKEKILISSIDHLKKSLSAEEDKSKLLSDKFEKITKISEELSEIIKAEN